MANKYKVPPFLKRDGESLLYNAEGQLLFVVPEKFFETKCAYEYGAYYCLVGMFNYCQVSKTGAKVGKVKPFHYPTMIMCKPSTVQRKVDGTELNKKFGSFDEDTKYRVLYFNKGDQVIQSVYTPEAIENVESFFSMFFITAKVSNTIPYDKLHEYFRENFNLNGGDYGITAQMDGIIISEICRDPHNIDNPYRLSKSIDKDFYSYNSVPITQIPKLISPFTAITSQNWDESIIYACNMDAENIKNTPLERVMTKG